jgi:malonate-semialdehyde dehydrogenase (acetylating)/methylmalonate-semialdehyde dehydrogenase
VLPDDAAADMGPLVTSLARDRVTGYMRCGRGRWSDVGDGWSRHQGRWRREGYFVGPTLFDHVQTQMSIYREEIFGPVLSVVRVPELRRRRLRS